MAAVLWAADARAQSSPWSVSFDLGAQLPVSGDVHAAGSGQVLGLPTQVESRSYEDVYGSGFGWAAGIGYRLGETGEFRVQGSYTSNPAERLQVGSVAGLPLFALFDDYKAFGMDFGYRQYLRQRQGAALSRRERRLRRLEEVKSEFSVPAAGVVLSNVDFYGASVVPSFAAGGGMQVRLSDMVALQGGIEFKWQGDAEDNDGLAGTGLESINDESRRWSLPVTGGITFRF